MPKPRIYIDTSCFIDLVSVEVGATIEDGRDGEVDMLKRIFKAHEEGAIEIFTSVLTIAECRYPKGGNLTDETKRIIRSVFESGKVVHLVEPTIFISEAARDLKWEHDISKMGGADAIHLATAIDRKCVEFLTVEQKVLDQIGKINKLGITPLLPSKTTVLPNRYKEMDLFQ